MDANAEGFRLEVGPALPLASAFQRLPTPVLLAVSLEPQLSCMLIAFPMSCPTLAHLLACATTHHRQAGHIMFTCSLPWDPALWPRPEQWQAANDATFRVPDQDGWQPVNEPIERSCSCPLGTRLVTRLPIPSLLRESGWSTLQQRLFPGSSCLWFGILTCWHAMAPISCSMACSRGVLGCSRHVQLILH